MINFETHPSRYQHWSLEIAEDVAKLTLLTKEDKGLFPGYKLKLNSYDLGVDIELADAIERLRFEHPQVRVVTVTGGLDKVFCAGANIFMLAQSAHAFKVNFCKFTNETRLNIEDASAQSGLRFLCAANGITAGGGYELALACDKILLLDDGNSSVSLPEVPLLGVLPGTGGLTRLVDKRKVRRDRADAFCTVAEGIKGKKAVEWKLVDRAASVRDFPLAIVEMQNELRSESKKRGAKGTVLAPLLPYRHVTLNIDENKRSAELCLNAPTTAQPHDPEAMLALGDDLWALRAYRELNHAILQLRMNFRDIALIVLKTQGDPQNLLAFEEALVGDYERATPHWYTIELMSLMKRTLKRLDITSKSMVALVEEKSCFCGSMAELLLCADQSFMRSVGENAGAALVLTQINRAHLPMANGLSRFEQHFCGDISQFEKAQKRSFQGAFLAEDCERFGLVTHVLDDIDYEDEVRIFCEERASLSPDALTGMEASLRFAGPETMESKIFARLSAWQNWIFIRENATGENGALTNYGKATRPQFDFERC